MAIDNKKTSVVIGVDRFHVAKLTSDPGTGTPTWGTPVFFPGVNEISINPNTESTSIYYDDGVADTFTSLGEIEVTVTKSLVSTEEYNMLLGHEITTDGVTLFSSSDVAPDVAIMFRTQMTNGQFKYIVLYKGKFGDSEETFSGKEDSVEAQRQELVGAFAKLSTPIQDKNLYKAVFDASVGLQEDGVLDAKSKAIADGWFNKVYVPGETM